MCLRLRDASHLVAFDEVDYKSAIRRMAELDRSGPLIYDVLHGLAALKYECETLLTFDVDFYRLGPDIAGIVKIPGDG